MEFDTRPSPMATPVLTPAIKLTATVPSTKPSVTGKGVPVPPLMNKTGLLSVRVLFMGPGANAMFPLTRPYRPVDRGKHGHGRTPPETPAHPRAGFAADPRMDPHVDYGGATYQSDPHIDYGGATSHSPTQAQNRSAHSRATFGGHNDKFGPYSQRPSRFPLRHLQKNTDTSFRVCLINGIALNARTLDVAPLGSRWTGRCGTPFRHKDSLFGVP